MEIQSIYNAALDITDASARAAFLDEACAGNQALRERVETLLAAHFRDVQFLEQGPVGAPTVEELPPRPEATGAYPQSPPLSTIIAGKYKIREKLGEGGMGAVYVVETINDVKAFFALKLIKPGFDSRHVLARFEQERQALALMNHPNIAKFIDAGLTETGQPFFVMELIKGLPITKYCDQEKLTVEERLNLFKPICQAVQHAHQKGIIHRDLKPGNILVANFDGVPVPKIIDFGVAKATLLPLTDKTIYSEIGSMIGTLEYMAPEQAEINSLDIDTRADLYSLGVILYELLTGTVPFSRKELGVAAIMGMLKMIREDDPPKPSTKLSGSGSLPSVAAQRKIDPGALTRKLHGELDWIVMKCLEKERNRRYDGPTQLSQDIENYLTDHPLLAGPPSASYRFRKFLKRNKGKVLAAALLLLSLVGGIIGTTWGMVKAVRAEKVAEVEAATAKATKELVENEILQQVDPAVQLESGFPLDKDIKLATLLDRASEKLVKSRNEKDQPLLIASLEFTLGKAYMALGEYKKALPRLERSAAIRKEKLGSGHQETLRALIEICRTHMKSKNIQGMKQSLPVLEQQASGTDITVEMKMDLMTFQALALENESQFARSLAIHEEMLKLREADPTERKHLAARVLCAIATDHMRLSDYTKSVETLQKALAIQRQSLGSQHPETLNTLLNLTTLYVKQGQPVLAEPLAKECLTAADNAYQKSHPFYMMALNNLAGVFTSQNKQTEALEIFQKLYAQSKEQRGDESPYTLNYQNNVATTQLFLKRYAEAEKSLLDMIPKMERTMGPTSQYTLIVRRNLVQTYEEQGRLAEAERELEKVLETVRSMKPVDSRMLFVELLNLTGLRMKLKKYLESRVLIEEAGPLEQDKTQLYMRAMLRRYRGELAMSDKDYAGAKKQLLESMEIMKSVRYDPKVKSFAGDERTALKATLQRWLDESKQQDAEIVRAVNDL